MKSDQTKPANGQRKKKAARACIHCQKAHLTCDDSRPCQRCIKRNLATTCTDGARKKAKYLQDIDDTTNPMTAPSTPFSPQSSIQTPNISAFIPEAFQAQRFLETGTPVIGNNGSENSLMNLENFNYGFGSNTTNLEYSILSNMLGSSLTTDATNPSSTPNSTQPSTDVLNLWPQQSQTQSQQQQQQSQSPLIESPLSIMQGPNSANSPFLSSPNQLTTTYTGNNNNNNNNKSVASIASSTMDTSQISASGVSTLSAYGDGAVVANVASPVTASTGPAVRRRNQIVTPEMAYASATKPFSYADGYHYLINYVKTRMSREDLMRISRALALFRPSVLASMMNLTEDDLIFTEKCLQRTLLEYEKLISYSGTPTVVWRRTGEITLVGKEFSLLTQWSRDMLLNKKTYIYELMSNPSAVEYWEKYALHAFDNTDSAVYSTCILISPTKRIVPCTFCFTIKRDIFDLPSVIVGNFLPILS
ncbi:Transcription activator of gluconeogenesis ERT1 [Choanephora cucurbitarum]|uniref:Transcription activator of gluconeogenesis ERT1 n=1 Tax=Choanephora cucurbitarum TaxID=101091 RepID=A0A1C7N6G6_9FUNG|nr:Transcription activator of gluconeogenesis ERT1 [Choanephora cucurbitarum]